MEQITQKQMTVKETYEDIYKRHYKYLIQNHMAKDRSERLSTIYAVENTWVVYNANSKDIKDTKSV